MEKPMENSPLSKMTKIVKNYLKKSLNIEKKDGKNGSNSETKTAGTVLD